MAQITSPCPSISLSLHDLATFGDTRTGWERFCIWFLACLVSCFRVVSFFGKIFLCGAHLSRWVPDSWYFGGASSRGHTYCRISVSGPPCALSCFGTWVPQRGPLLCAWVNQSWQLPHPLSFLSLSPCLCSCWLVLISLWSLMLMAQLSGPHGKLPRNVEQHTAVASFSWVPKGSDHRSQITQMLECETT